MQLSNLSLIKGKKKNGAWTHEATGIVFEATRVVPEREPEMELEVGVLMVNCWD